MEDRVSKLEQQFANIDSQLAEIKTLVALTAKATDVAEIKGRLSELPKSSDFVRLSADVSRLAERTAGLPSTWQMMLGFLGIIVAILWKSK